MSSDYDSNSNSSDLPVSKSQRKREAQALQDLARELADLSPGKLARIPLSPRLREAVEDAQRITQHIARKREVQFVGKLLREVDPQPIRDALDQLAAPGRAEQARFHRLEAWRDALIEQGDPLINRLCETHGAAERQQLRQLVRKARSEAERGKPPAAARKLFRTLSDLDRADTLPAPPA